MSPEFTLSSGETFSVNGNVDLLAWHYLDVLEIYIDARQANDILEKLKKLNGTKGRIAAVGEDNLRGRVFYGTLTSIDEAEDIVKDMYGLSLIQWQTRDREYPERALIVNKNLKVEMIIGRTPHLKRRYYNPRRQDDRPDLPKYIIRY